jgi:hypothetical protein
MQTTAAASVLAIHVMGGLIAIVGGFAALAFRKGSLEHRNAGVTFFWGMMIMSVGAACLGYIRSELNDIVAAVTIAYLVTTARWAIQGEGIRDRFLEAGACVVAIVITVANVAFALPAANAGGTLYGHPAMLYWISASITGLTASLDLNFVLRQGLSRKHRLVRHLWRMCFALWIAVASFFLGQMKVFPDVLRNAYLLATPVLIVFLAMIYWLVRMLVVRRGPLGYQDKNIVDNLR